jgi:multidrug transporter EmrE-like cation transporter
MSITGVILVLLTAGLTMIANLMIRAGIDHAGGVAASGVMELVMAVFKLFLQPLFAIGFVIYFLGSVVWFRVVATEPLSVAYPVLVSLTFSLVTAGAVILFHEALSVRKVLGLIVILAGIVVISMDKGTT